MRITSKGQVTIPQEYRSRYGLLPNTEVEFVAKGAQLQLRKVRKASGKGWKLIEHMRGRGTGHLTTDEILKLTRG
jgi:AbrB family looped-hinge helix DNA binding protein